MHGHGIARAFWSTVRSGSWRLFAGVLFVARALWSTVRSGSGRLFAGVLFVAYFALIPVFAYVYTSRDPNGFYAPGAHLEPSFEGKLQRARDYVESALRRSSTKEYQEGRTVLSVQYYAELRSGVDTDPTKMIIIKDVYISDFDTDDGKEFSVTVNVFPEADPKISNATGILFLSGRLISSGSEAMNKANIGGPGGILLRPTAGFRTPLGDVIFRSVVPKTIGQSERVVRLDYKEWEAMRRIHNEWEGQTDVIGGDYWRMLYFSAVTATTLGFGDIVPLTPAARCHVTIEAILGVMFAGAFFFALANAVADQSSKKISQELKTAIAEVTAARKQFEEADRKRGASTSTTPRAGDA